MDPERGLFNEPAPWRKVIDGAAPRPNGRRAYSSSRGTRGPMVGAIAYSGVELTHGEEEEHFILHSNSQARVFTG